MMSHRTSAHEESWLLLPWLANGRLSHAERASVEEHLRECAACAQELTRQRLLCEALTEPERVTYAPGPSFRKLMERIDAEPPVASRPTAEPPVASRPTAAAAFAGVWRPPGLAWAASFVLAIACASLVTTAYHWAQPRYTTVTAARPATPGVLHVAFDRSLPLGELEELLRTAGARVVEGPDTMGIFGVGPAPAASEDLRVLSARLRADARVRWVEPLGATAEPGDAQGPPTGGR